jgi:glycolate oxidase
LGLAGFDQIDKSYTYPAPSLTVPHVHSAFPLLNLADEGYGGGR